jgi:hypothetical protein
VATWPPPLDDLKTDLSISLAETRDDARLTQVLDAAVAFVQRVRPEYRYDPLDPDQAELPEPTADLWLGTLRLAGRWHTRRRSPDAMVQMAELGASRIPSFDPDIDRLLRIGKYRGPVIA